MVTVISDRATWGSVPRLVSSHEGMWVGRDMWLHADPRIITLTKFNGMSRYECQFVRRSS